MVKTKHLKHPYFWLQSFFSSSACNCLEVLYVVSGKRSSITSISFIGLFFVIFYCRRLSAWDRCSSAVKCSLLAREFWKLLVLAIINALLTCSQMLSVPLVCSYTKKVSVVFSFRLTIHLLRRTFMKSMKTFQDSMSMKFKN